MVRLRAKLGNAEIEVESESNSYESLLRAALDSLDALRGRASVESNAPIHDRPDDENTNSGGSRRAGTINTAIAKLGGDTCRAVMEAAAIHLTMFEGKARFTLDEWEARSKESNSWKVKWSAEKATNKKRLIDSGFVIENSAGVFSLSADARKDAEAKLA